MATIHKYETAGGTRYEVRYRQPSGKTTRKRGFERKIDARRWAERIETTKQDGTYVAPSLGRVTVGELADKWLELKRGAVKPAYATKLESAWRVHVAPDWADVAVGKVAKSDVQLWVNSIGKSATVVQRAHGVLAGILDLAVDDGLVPHHQARGVTLPKKQKGLHAYLTPDQVRLLLTTVPAEHAPFVQLLVTTGLRWGEATALKGSDIDRRRKRVRVERTMYYDAKLPEKYGVGPVKTHEARAVPIAADLLDGLPLVIGDALVFPGTDGRMRPYQTATGWFAAAVRACQAADREFPRITPHDLRHTAASLAVSSGANVKAVQRMLGHASAAMTLDQYADLFDSDLDAVAVSIAALIA